MNLVDEWKISNNRLFWKTDGQFLSNKLVSNDKITIVENDVISITNEVSRTLNSFSFGHVTKNVGLKEHSNLGPAAINSIKKPIFSAIKKV